MYKWIIFDADETLFRFDSYGGLVHMFSKYGITFSASDFDEYQAINKPLWVAYQDQTITAEQLQTRRFEKWAEKLSVSAKQLNHDYLESMAAICELLPGAKELVEHLASQNIQMAIITNGFTQLQKVRLERTGLEAYFSHVVISEQVGVSKPNKAIFEHTFALMNHPDKEDILMVGDTLMSDIQGGINAGIDTCWLNHDDKDAQQTIIPTYQVISLVELKSLIENQM